MVAEYKFLAIYFSTMNHRRSTKRSPRDKRWCAPVHIDHDLAAVQVADRVGPGVTINFNADDKLVVRPRDLFRPKECRIVDGSDGISNQELAEALRHLLSSSNGVIETTRSGWRPGPAIGVEGGLRYRFVTAQACVPSADSDDKHES